jgi:hypothetical protein
VGSNPTLSAKLLSATAPAHVAPRIAASTDLQFMTIVESGIRHSA